MTKLERIRAAIKEAEAQKEKYSTGTPRRSDWERELQRLRNVEHQLIKSGCGDTLQNPISL